MAVKIHNPNIIGEIDLASSAGVAGQVVTSAGAGVQSVWSTPASVVTVAVTDTTSVDLTIAGAPAYNLSADVIVSGNAGNQLTSIASGLFVPDSSIVVAGCPTLSGLTPGATYVITGLTQGNLGTFAVTTIAKSATELGEAVTVFPSGEAKSYLGLIDWADCQLIWVHDTRNNDIEGKANISAFVWFDNLYTNNSIDDASTIALTGAINSFTNNLLYKTAMVVTDNGSILTINGNVFKESTITITAPTGGLVWDITNNEVQKSIVNCSGTGALLLDSNLIELNSTLTISATSTDLTVQNNRLSPNSTMTFSHAGTSSVFVNNNDLNSSTITTNGATFNRTCFITNNTGIDASTFALTGVYAATATANPSFANILLTGFSTASAIGSPAGTRVTLNFAHLSNNSSIVFDTLGGVVTRIVVESQGQVVPSGFSLTNSRYERINPFTAAANDTDVHRSGYGYIAPNLVGNVLLNADAGTSGQVLTSAGAGVQSTWSTPIANSSGTFTPRFEGTGTAGTWAYNVQQGYYSIIGNMLFFNLYLSASSRSVAPTGNARIAGLPTASNSAANNYNAVALNDLNNLTLSATNVQLVGQINPGATTILLVETLGTAPSVATALLATSLGTAPEIIITGQYRI